MNIIHPQSDIKLHVSTEELGGEPLIPFTFHYFTTDRSHYVELSYDGNRFTNGERCEGGVTAFWKCPHFYPGQLKVLKHFHQPDDRFSDDLFNYLEYTHTTTSIYDGAIAPRESTSPGAGGQALRGEPGPQGECGPKGDKGDTDQSYTDSRIAALEVSLVNKALGTPGFDTVNGNIRTTWAGFGVLQAEKFRQNDVMKTTANFQGVAVNLPTTNLPTIVSFYARVDSGTTCQIQSATNLTNKKPYIKSDEAITSTQWRQYWIYCPNGCVFQSGACGVIEFHAGNCYYSSLKVEYPAKVPSEWAPDPQDKLNPNGDASRLTVKNGQTSIPLFLNGKINPALL